MSTATDPLEQSPRRRVPVPGRRALVWSVLVAPALFLALLVGLDRPPRLDEAYEVHAAWRSLDPRREPPTPGAPRTRVAVPDSVLLPGQALKAAWYRLDPTRRQLDSPPLALYSPEPDANLALYIDGTAVGDGGRLDFPPAYHEFPLLLPIPDGVLHERSRIELYSVRDGRYATLAPLYLGPADELARSASRVWWMRAGVVRVGLIVAFCLALLATGFFMLRPDDSAYGWFALTLLFWILHVGHDHVVSVPVPRVLWLASTAVTLGAFVYCAVVFVHRFVGIAARRVEVSMMLVLVLGAVAFYASALSFGWRWHGLLIRIWVPLVLIAGLYLVGRLAQAAWRRPSLERHALLGAAITTLLIGMRDFLYDISIWRAGSVFYLGYALMLVVGVFGAIVVRRFAMAVGESESLSRDLEQRVAQKSRELEANYARLRELEAEEAQRRERERLMREVHDGIGGQLVQGLALAEHGGSPAALRAVLEECLVDLRLVVDAVDVGDGDGDVLNLLARFRHRIGRRLEALGIELDWQVADVPARAFGTAEALQVLRILQEAFAALLSHASTRRIAVVTGVDAAQRAWIELRIAGGTAASLPGITSMQARAAQIGGTLAVTTAVDVTTVHLGLPQAAGDARTGA